MKHARVVVSHYGGPEDSIQTLMRLKRALFREDLIALFELLEQKKIRPIVARRFPLTQARQAHELLGKGGITGKIVLVREGPPLEAGEPRRA